jgi:hypothetical protein
MPKVVMLLRDPGSFQEPSMEAGCQLPKNIGDWS